MSDTEVPTQCHRGRLDEERGNRRSGPPSNDVRRNEVVQCQALPLTGDDGKKVETTVEAMNVGAVQCQALPPPTEAEETAETACRTVTIVATTLVD